MDYKELERGLMEIADRYGCRPKNEKPPFKGTNFMTPRIICQNKLSNGIWYELSYGTGLKAHHIIGVTFRGCEEKSGCCYTLEEVENLLKEANEYDF